MPKTNTEIMLKDIPVELMPVMTSTDHGTIWLHDKIVKAIFIFNNRIRISTNQGEHRFDLDSEQVITIL
jgi:hypothetical protein